jgi:transcriptional regulator with XRE-family HTH domain
MKIGKTILKARNRLNLSQKDLCRLTNLHRSTLSRIENDKHYNLKTETIERLNQTLGIKLQIITEKDRYKQKRLNKIKKIAYSKGHECLSNEYTSSKDDLDFKCKKCGHEWSSSYDNYVNKNTGCEQCYHQSQKKPKKDFQKSLLTVL